MRFNSKELAHLGQQASHNYDREGFLSIKQKNDKLFKKGEAFVERFFRLRGNLLFYFKDKNFKPDPQGVFVLERCTVELDVNEQQNFSFVIVFEGDDEIYTFSAKTEDDRDGWIQALHVSSYECLKMQLQSLREQVQAKTGKDPMVHMMPSDTGMEFETQAGGSADDPAMEISLEIEGLPNDSTGLPPNPFVVIYIIVPPQQQNWLQHNHTEMVEKNNSPHFLKTVGFGDSSGLEPTTRVKVTVYHVKERMTGTMTQIGQVIFTLNELLLSTDMKLTLCLLGTDNSKVGKLKIVGWLNEGSGSVVDMQGGNVNIGTSTKNERNDPPVVRWFEMYRSVAHEVFLAEARQTRPLSFKRRSKRLDTLKPMCENITTRTFQFETNDSVKLMVYEYMAESKYTFEIPIKVLKLFIEEEKLRIKQLNDLGQLPQVIESHVVVDINYCAAVIMEYTDNVNILACFQGSAMNHPHIKLAGIWRVACHEFKDICMSAQSTYAQHIKYLSTYKGNSFKPSSKKGDKELEFVPVNLHMQRMTVLNQSTEECGCYDIVTVGAFAAHTRKFRTGGLSRMLQLLQDQYTPEGTLSKVSKVKRACQLVNNLFKLQIEIIQICESVCQEALQGNADSLTSATSDLADKVKELVLDCESPILQETASKLSDIHEEFEALAEQKLKAKDNEKSPEKDWKWTGKCFVKSPTMEPWDMTRVNTEAALVCLTSMVEDLVKNKSGTMDRPKWLGDISPAVMKLKSFVEIVCQKANHFMSFLDLMEHKDNLKLMHTIKCRRDVAFSHALTSLVTGFMVHINSYLDNAAILEQLRYIGVLVQMEGLLSCHSDETGMLEDMVVAMDDLATVTFKLVQETAQKNSIELQMKSFKKAGLYPDLNRHHICVEVPMKKQSFEKLPQKLQAGSEVRVIPVFFNVGINEQQTLAEKFGSTGLQDKTNEESLGRLFQYVEEFEEINCVKEENVVGSIPELMSQLRYNVYTKKSKNVEILHLSAELCRKLHGIRFTCCKSAKDRTAMSVTLEQVQILQRDHDLASHVFSHSLDCFRSEGVRRENTFKNIGARKYAFNSLQLLSFPKQYRPPNGTYGNVQN